MNPNFFQSTQTAIALALLSNILFGLSCIVFARFTAKYGSIWVNILKGLISTFCFFLLVIFMNNFSQISWDNSKLYFVISGGLGLAMADFFLLSSLRHNGVAETLIFYAFQPFLVYLGAHYLWHESLAPSQWVGVFIFCLCLFIFCYDKYQISKVKLSYALMALVAIILDTCGILITKSGFHLDPSVDSVVVCFFRGLGALGVMFITTFIRPTNFIQKWQNLKIEDKSLAAIGCFVGTFLSLLFYLKAVQIGPLTVISAIAVATPLWATFFEFFYYKKKPTKVFMTCFCLYLTAFTWNFLNQ